MKIGLFLLLLATLLILYRVFSARSRDTTKSHPPARQEALMSADRAAAILGLAKDCTVDDVIAAHRRLMQKLHPDKGGSAALAQELNEAKRVLLKSLRS